MLIQIYKKAHFGYFYSEEEKTVNFHSSEQILCGSREGTLLESAVVK